MGKAMEVITGRVLNPGATITALTANTNNSFTIRSFPDQSPAYLSGLWAQNASAGIVRVRSPRMHDNVQNIRYRSPAALIRDFLPDDVQQRLYPNDPLTFEMSGGGAETDSAAFLAYYTDLPGIDARLSMWEQVKPRVRNMLTVEVPVVGPTTAGDWSPGTAITALTDLLKSDTDYALLGWQTDTQCLAVAVSSADTGNLRIGGPGTTESIETRDWLISLGKALAMPTIPILNSNNRGSTQTFVALNTAGGTINVSLTLCELAP